MKQARAESKKIQWLFAILQMVLAGLRGSFECLVVARALKPVRQPDPHRERRTVFLPGQLTTDNGT
jgi:hypothetical protein